MLVKVMLRSGIRDSRITSVIVRDLSLKEVNSKPHGEEVNSKPHRKEVYSKPHRKEVNSRSRMVRR